MTNGILDGISIKLAEEFGDKYKIYADEDVEQGFKKPSFFIASLRNSLCQITGPRYYRECLFDVHYFPDKEGNNIEMLDIAARLCGVLEYARTEEGVLFRGGGMSYEIADGVLHFFVQYGGFALRKEVKAKMGKLTVKENVKR